MTLFQASVRELRGLGISPDLIVCRSEKPVDDSVKAKISNFCHVEPDQVINISDCPTIYHVPLALRHQGLVKLLSRRLNLPMPMDRKFLSEWKGLANRAEHLRKVRPIFNFFLGNQVYPYLKLSFRRCRSLLWESTPSSRMPTPR